MKKNLKMFIRTFSLIVFVLAFSSCDFSVSSDSASSSDSSNSSASGSGTIVQASEEESWSYDESRPVYVVSSDVSSLSISGGIAGKTLYFVQVNPKSSAISSRNLRIVTNSEQLGQTTSSSLPFSSRSAASQEDSSESALIAGTDEIASATGHKHFYGEKLPLPVRSSSSRSALSSASYSTEAQSAEQSWSVGEAKSIYVDTDSSLSTFEQKSATLYATGKNCYVWIVDSYYSSTSSGNQVNESVAEKYASTFDEIYPYITNVFGDESNEIINYGENSIVDMESVSDTGEKINIVIYDIGADYGSSSSSGVVGYFYAKDYYYVPSGTQVSTSDSIVGKSNVGKYFYIDSAFANSDFDTTISTLAHEFQHMIDFNQKDLASLKKYLAGEILKDEILSPDTSYNEMLSMLCEDMMQEKLGLEDYASPKNRIQNFNAYYYMSGIREYRNDDYAALSYSTAYAFGSWLSRQYGGAALVSEISQNEYDGNESIVAAVNKLNGTSKSFDDLFEEFVLAITGSTESHNETYTHNQNAAETLSYESYYYYPMEAFNLWDSSSTTYESDGETETYTFSLSGTTFASQYKSYAYSGYDWNGPFVLSASASVSALRADYGIAIHAVGEYDSSAASDTLTFSSSGASGLELYIVIQ